MREHIYKNADGSIFGRKTGKDFWENYENGCYYTGLGGKKAPIYRLDQIKDYKTVVLVEGEKDADTLWSFDIPATTGAHGGNTWEDQWTDSFSGKTVLICPDCDKTGEHYTLIAGRAILPVAQSVSVLTLPPMQEGHKDVSDLLEEVGKERFADIWEDMRSHAQPFVDLHEHGTNGDAEKKSDLPEIISACDLCSNPLIVPPEVITGLLHQGSKMSLGGGSKSFKTWTLLQMAICMASGEKWLGFETCGKPVIYINLELEGWAVTKRILDICNAMQIPIPKDLRVWNLRGYACGAKKLFPKLIKEIDKYGYVCGLLDPIYKVLGDGDENSARDIGKMLNQIEKFAIETQIAVAYGAHFSKGNQSTKEAIDRMSGSGVFARDPDSILTLTPHEDENCFTLDMILRNFPPQDPFVVRREHPLMVGDWEKDPGKLRKPKVPNAQQYDKKEILGFMDFAKPIKTEELCQSVMDETGMSRRTFYDLWKILKAAKEVTVIKGGWVKK